MLSVISTMLLMTNAFVIKRHQEIVTKCEGSLNDDFIVDEVADAIVS